ncbi:MAG: hypothetical protein R3Y53_04055 [Bacillota bacterium]
MEKYQNAVDTIAQGNILEGMEEIAKLYTKDMHSDDLIAYLKTTFLTPALPEIEDCFQKNTVALSQYSYIFLKEFKNISENDILYIPVTDEIAYVLNTSSGTFEKIEISSKKETSYFFKNLENAICAENELNAYNLKFLVDNVRKSEDVAYENHIYLRYDTPELFSLLLYHCDFAPLLADKKLVILIGEEEKKMYPIDFKEKFNIDYKAMTFQEIRPEEVKRLTLQLPSSHLCEQEKYSEIIDGHRNVLSAAFVFDEYANHLLTIDTPQAFFDQMDEALDKECTIDTLIRTFPFYSLLIYPNFKDVEEFKRFYKILKDMFLQYDITTKKDLFVIEHLSFTKYCGRTFEDRIVPMVYSGMYTENNVLPLDFPAELSEDFAYRYQYVPIRDFLSAFSTVLNQKHLKFKEWQEAYSNNLNLTSKEEVMPEEDLETDTEDILEDENLEFRTFVRFEDLKQNPKATIASFAEFLNLPYTEELENCYFMKQPYFTEEELKNSFAFSVTNEKKEGLLELNTYDIYRIETSIFPLWEQFHYKPSMLPTGMATHKHFLMEPFFFEPEEVESLFERANYSYQDYRVSFFQTMIAQAFVFETIKQHLFQGQFAVLEPKKELLENPLYENMKSVLDM